MQPRWNLIPEWKNFCLHVNFIPGWNLIWKKTSHWVWWKHNKISHFSQLLKSEAWYVKNRRLKARCIKWLRLNAWGLQLYLQRDSEFCQISKNTFFTENFWATAYILREGQRLKQIEILIIYKLHKENIKKK